MTNPIVLDASAGVEMLLTTEVGRVIRERLPVAVEEWVPEIYLSEVAGTLRRAELSGRVRPERAAIALGDLLAGPQRRVQVRTLLPEAGTLRHNLTINDALYVVLARHLGAALVTADMRLAKAPRHRDRSHRALRRRAGDPRTP